MNKISGYIYPNRVEVIAALPGFTVEFTKLYQRHIKIYNGVDNTIEFDIKNADQKRIDLSTLSNLEINIMDNNGFALPNSPYTLELLPIKGIATVTIPSDDLHDIATQYLKYSITAVKDGKDVLVYCDAEFGAVGTLSVVGTATPAIRDEKVYNAFTGEIDLAGNITNHSSAIPATFYEAVPTSVMDFEVNMTGFVGTIYLEATTSDTISIGSFQNAPQLASRTFVSPFTGMISFSDIQVDNFTYFRINWQNGTYHGTTGTVDSITVIS